jgi:NADH dehydrogenase
MRIAVTGGDGFVGGALVERLRADGHEAVVLSRRARVDLASASVDDLARRLIGCDAMVLAAGINREIGTQTYAAVHVEATRRLLQAAEQVGVRRVVLVSFLRARPDGPTAYHRSKWAAEELVRASPLDHTILKPGVIFGRGDHLLDHLSRAVRTFPVFGLVGLTARDVRPVAVDDVARILAAAALGDDRLRDRTLVVLGPETLTLEAAVRRVAVVNARRPWFVPLPIAVHRLLARLVEAVMVVPIISKAQVEILAEGVVQPLPYADGPPPDLVPATPFDQRSIRAGLPPGGGFTCRDLRWCAR